MTAQTTIAAKQTPLSNAELEQALRQVLRLQLSLAIPALEKALERQLSQSTPMPGETFRQVLERQLPSAAPEREKVLQQALFQAAVTGYPATRRGVPAGTGAASCLDCPPRAYLRRAGGGRHD